MTASVTSWVTDRMDVKLLDWLTGRLSDCLSGHNTGRTFRDQHCGFGAPLLAWLVVWISCTRTTGAWSIPHWRGVLTSLNRSVKLMFSPLIHFRVLESLPYYFLLQFSSLLKMLLQTLGEYFFFEWRGPAPPSSDSSITRTITFLESFELKHTLYMKEQNCR